MGIWVIWLVNWYKSVQNIGKNTAPLIYYTYIWKVRVLSFEKFAKKELIPIPVYRIEQKIGWKIIILMNNKRLPTCKRNT